MAEQTSTQPTDNKSTEAATKAFPSVQETLIAEAKAAGASDAFLSEAENFSGFEAGAGIGEMIGSLFNGDVLSFGGGIINLSRGVHRNAEVDALAAAFEASTSQEDARKRAEKARLFGFLGEVPVLGSLLFLPATGPFLLPRIVTALSTGFKMLTGDAQLKQIEAIAASRERKAIVASEEFLKGEVSGLPILASRVERATQYLLSGGLLLGMVFTFPTSIPVALLMGVVAGTSLYRAHKVIPQIEAAQQAIKNTLVKHTSKEAKAAQEEADKVPKDEKKNEEKDDKGEESQKVNEMTNKLSEAKKQFNEKRDQYRKLIIQENPDAEQIAKLENELTDLRLSIQLAEKELKGKATRDDKLNVQRELGKMQGNIAARRLSLESDDSEGTKDMINILKGLESDLKEESTGKILANLKERREALVAEGEEENKVAIEAVDSIINQVKPIHEQAKVINQAKKQNSKGRDYKRKGGKDGKNKGGRKNNRNRRQNQPVTA